MLRCLIHKKEIDIIEQRFTQTELGQKTLNMHPYIWFQLLREYFHIESNASERLNYILTTWDFSEKHFSLPSRNRIYCEVEKDAHIESYALTLWEEELDNKKVKIEINFMDGEIKEGCLTIALRCDNFLVYHMNFWIAPSLNDKNKLAAYIGCHQGSKEGLDINRELTKSLFGSRPKNFVFIALQTFIRESGIANLFGVSNKGHFSSRLVKSDRKPKFSYDEFWTECGGTPCDDQRFFILPNQEIRKSYEEIPSKKRSTYRKRYELIDRMASSIKTTLIQEINPKQ